jgi:uncharacterized protein
MKYLVLFAVLLVVYLLWKHQRTQERAGREGGNASAGSARTAAPPAASPQEMVRCPVCDLHLPRADAVADAQGRLFCSAAHRDGTRA